MAGGPRARAHMRRDVGIAPYGGAMILVHAICRGRRPRRPGSMHRIFANASGAKTHLPKTATVIANRCARRCSNPFSPPGAIFFLRSQKEYGKKNLPREGLVETAPPLEPTPVCISSHRHMPGDASAAYCGGIQEIL